MRLEKEAKALLRCATFSLDEHDAEYVRTLFDSSSFDWDGFWELTMKHQMYHILYSHLCIEKTLAHDAMPSRHANMLKQLYMSTLVRNTIMFKEIQRITERFEQGNMKPVFLKGPVLCEKLYKDIGLRSFGDFDVLIHQEHVNTATQLLRDMGYVSEREFDPKHVSVSAESWPGHPHEEPMIRKGDSSLVPIYEVEIHRFYPYYGVDVSEMMSNIEKTACGGGLVWTLSEIDHTIFLLVHIYQHLLTGYGRIVFTTLRMFCEVKECLMLIRQKNEVQRLLERIRDVEAQVPAYVGLVFMNYVYGDLLSLEFLESIRPEENVKYQLGNKLGCGERLPVTFEEMLLFDRVKQFADYNTKLNGVGFGETVLLFLLEPGNVKEAIIKEIGEKRQDKHELHVNPVPVSGSAEKTVSVDWEILPSYFLPEKGSAAWHFFGGNLQDGIAPKDSEELSMEYKLAWNPDYLHFWACINDSTLVVRQGEPCDGVTLNFDAEGYKIHYGIYLPFEKSVQIMKPGDSGWKPLKSTSAVTSCEIYDGQGYVLEAAIPWNELEIQPQAGMRFKFDIELIDFADESERPKTILVWSGGDGLGWRFSDVFGTVVLDASCAKT